MTVRKSTVPIDKLCVQSGGSVDESGQTLVVRTGLVAPAASLTNGTTQMIGAGPLLGSFDRLMIGQLDGVCGGVNASLLLVTAKTLDVYCPTRVDSIARAQALRVHATGGTARAAERRIVARREWRRRLLGRLAPGRQWVPPGGRHGHAQSDATFADTGRQLFNSGTLSLGGNFTQLDPGVANFDASADHATILSGAKPQVINFADPNSSHFGRLEIDNPLGVAFDTSSNQPVSVPTARTIVLRPNGAMIVGSNATVSLSGGIFAAHGWAAHPGRIAVGVELQQRRRDDRRRGVINDLLATLFACQ